MPTCLTSPKRSATATVRRDEISDRTKALAPERLTLLPRTRRRIQRSTRLNETIPKLTTPPTQHIAHHIRALRVPGEHQLRVRTPRRVRLHGLEPVALALRHGLAVVGALGVVEEDILVVAGGQAVADGAGELALPARVGLVPALGEEDVHVAAVGPGLSGGEGGWFGGECGG